MLRAAVDQQPTHQDANDMPSPLQKLLQQLQTTEGLKYAFVFDRDGIPLTSEENLPDERNKEMRHAMAIGMGAIKKMGEILSGTQVQRAIIQLEGARLLLIPLATKAVLGILSDESYNMGMLMTEGNAWEKKFLEAMDMDLSSPGA